MASDGNAGKIPVANLVQGSRAATSIVSQSGSGKALPSAGKSAAIPDPARQVSGTAQALVDQLNKHSNDSGRPDQYRVDPASDGKLIQQLNPATGAVIGEFAASEFPALARSIGVSGLLIDSRA